MTDSHNSPHLSSEESSKILNMIINSFHLDKCIKDSSHTVELASGNPKIFYCKVCDECYGFDDSTDISSIIETCKLSLCLEKCAKCGNNDPNHLMMQEGIVTCEDCKVVVLDFNTTEMKNTSGLANLKLTELEEDLNLKKLNNCFSISASSPHDKNNNSINDPDECYYTPINNPDECYYTPIICKHCDSQEGLPILNDDGKLKEVVCTGCQKSDYFNYSKFKHDNSKHSEERKEKDNKKSFLTNGESLANKPRIFFFSSSHKNENFQNKNEAQNEFTFNDKTVTKEDVINCDDDPDKRKSQVFTKTICRQNNIDSSKNNCSANNSSLQYAYGLGELCYDVCSKYKHTRKCSSSAVKKAFRTSIAVATSRIVLSICDFISNSYPMLKNVIDTYKGPFAAFVQMLTNEILNNMKDNSSATERLDSIKRP
ncbi:hypothetical protein HELRODRAFT_163244 [Helobdella robusta]|uniref:Uncharacterized protein n=1 Tax=Helobdella robusta TaxID=6412 RepID=T1ETU0_HELRO|nr:hypothetical protein HELRODRAFT_163244 [Helobdella robusta]ESN96203.1 hypothetical protein HELRODRAFT_163244 [Helobdella robusta]